MFTGNSSFSASPGGRRLRRPRGAGSDRARGPRRLALESLEQRTLFSVDPGFAFGLGAWADDAARAVAVDDGGNVYVAGEFEGSVDFDPGPGSHWLHAETPTGFLAKYSPSGALRWAHSLGVTVADIAVDADGNVHATGAFYGTVDFDPHPEGVFELTNTGHRDIFVLNLDTHGDFVWARSMGGEDWTNAVGIALGPDGCVYTTGQFAGTADFDPDPDAAFALTCNDGSLGAASDVYVSKLDAGGNFVWAGRLGGSGYDQVADLAVGPDGSVHVTGLFRGRADFDPDPDQTFELNAGDSDSDIYIAKLDTIGQLCWARSMGSGSTSEWAGGIAVGADGSVYTTGGFSSLLDFDPGPGTYELNPWISDAFVSKLDAAGHFAWARSVAGPGDASGSALSIGIDGNVYLTGRFTDTAYFGSGDELTTLVGRGEGDVFVAKLDMGGQHLWAHAVGGSGSDAAVDIAIGSDGNILITGTFRDTADFDPGPASSELTSQGGDDAFVARLRQRAVGGVVWNDLNGDGLRDPDEPPVAGAAVELFGSRDGQVGNADDISCAMTVTDAQGRYLMTEFLPAGAYYVAFRPPAAIEPYCFTEQDAGQDDGRDSDADAAGRTAVFGLLSEPNKVNVDAGLVGTAPAVGYALGAGGGGIDEAKTVAHDTYGNVYTAGRFQGTVDFDHGPGVYELTSVGSDDAFVAKYSPTGALVWARSMGGPGYDAAEGLVVTSEDEVYVAGYFRERADFDPSPTGLLVLQSAGGADAFACKLNGDGRLVWAGRMGGPGDDLAYDVTVDNYRTLGYERNVWIAGAFWGTADFDPGAGTYTLTSDGDAFDAFVTRLDTDGDFAWAGRMGGEGADMAGSIVSGPGGFVYVGGTFQGSADFDPNPQSHRTLTSAGGADAFVVKLHRFDDWYWARRIGGAGNDAVHGLAVTQDSQVCVAGQFHGTASLAPAHAGTLDLTSAGGADIFVAQLDRNGYLEWARAMGGEADDAAYDIALAADGTFYLTGRFNGTADFDPDPDAVDELTSAGYSDAFLAQLDGAGDFGWAQRVGGASFDVGKGVSIAAHGSAVVVGSFHNDAVFDVGSGTTFKLSSAGGSDAFVAAVQRIEEAPTTPGIPSIVVPHGVAQSTIDLFAAFEDDHDADAELTFAVTSNTNPALFASLAIDAATGTLVLEYAPRAVGTARIEVRATDTDGLWAAASFTVTVCEATNLGAIDFLRLDRLDPTSRDLWYRLRTVREGFLTVEADYRGQPGLVEVALFDSAFQPVAPDSPELGTTRIDTPTEAGQEYFVRLRGKEAPVTLSFANLVSVEPDGTVLWVHGTGGDDDFEGALGCTHQVSVNGIQYDTEDLRSVTSIQFAGGCGSDRLTFVGFDLDETAVLAPGSLRLDGPCVAVRAADVESIAVYGGGGDDKADFVDSEGNDTFTARPDMAELSGDGFRLQTFGFGTVRARSMNGGEDLAALYDSPANDRFVAGPDESTLQGHGFSAAVNDFDFVHAYALSGGKDTAEFHDSAGQDHFVGRPEFSWMQGPGFFCRAKFFEDVFAYSENGSDDVAELRDSRGNDQFTAAPGEGTMITQDLDGRIATYHAEGFRYLHGYGIQGGYDTASLTGTKGDDVFKVFADQRVPYGFLTDWDTYFVRAKKMDVVVAYGNGGHDVATFKDSPGDDTLDAYHDYVKFFGPGHYSRAHGFAESWGLAHCHGGDRDMAQLHGSPGNDTFTATPEMSTLEGCGYKHVALRFDYVHAYGGEGREVARFYGSPGDDRFVGKPDFSYLYGDGFFCRAKFFEEVYADVSQGGNDTADVHGSALEDVLQASDLARRTWARLSSKNDSYDFLYDLLAFDAVKAHVGHEDTVPPQPLPPWLVLESR